MLQKSIRPAHQAHAEVYLPALTARAACFWRPVHQGCQRTPRLWAAAWRWPSCRPGARAAWGTLRCDQCSGLPTLNQTCFGIARPLSMPKRRRQEEIVHLAGRIPEVLTCELNGTCCSGFTLDFNIPPFAKSSFHGALAHFSRYTFERPSLTPAPKLINHVSRPRRMCLHGEACRAS